jgi:hypothetical protein
LQRQWQHGAEVRSVSLLPPLYVSSSIYLDQLSLPLLPSFSLTRAPIAGNTVGGGVSQGGCPLQL